MELKDRLKEKRLAAGFTLEELAQKIGTSKQTIHRYETGVISNIPSDKVEALAEALKTTPAYLMGWTQNDSPLFESAAGEGRINDGYPTEEYKIHLEADEFISRVRGRSMEPTLMDGDVVVITAQNVPDHDGQICLVRIDGEKSALKRVQIKSNGIMLTGDNVDVYPPHFYTDEEVRTLPVTIEGTVTKLIREIK